MLVVMFVIVNNVVLMVMAMVMEEDTNNNKVKESLLFFFLLKVYCGCAFWFHLLLDFSEQQWKQLYHNSHVCKPSEKKNRKVFLMDVTCKVFSFTMCCCCCCFHQFLFNFHVGES
ncbi:hypothetical protein RJT34_17233 [Clitoria ternatea]|uniref:Secreted protein n=1 Tax=Clitoria ternatea TaxID=43366 RepID=A0AAN9J9U7_CLITE